MSREKNSENSVSFENIVSAYERKLLAYVVRITGNPSISEDIVQNSFIKLAVSWRGELVIGTALSAWLYRVTHNEAVDWVRRESKRMELHEKHRKERELCENASARDFPSDAAVKAENALLSLSTRERNLVVLRIYEDRSYREISEITGLSVGNVGFILHHAMKKLAEYLTKEGIGND